MTLYALCVHDQLEGHWATVSIWCEGAKPATARRISLECTARHMTQDDSWELSNAREEQRLRRNREIGEMGGGG